MQNILSKYFRIVNELTSLLNKWNANQWRKNSEKAVALLETLVFSDIFK